jgi:preprotein translocase subunit SecF
VKLSEVRKALDEGGLTGADLQEFPSVKKVLVVIKKAGAATHDSNAGAISAGVSDKVIAAVTHGIKDRKLTVDSVSEIGPKVGSRLRTDAMWAVIASVAGILVYVGWRFQFSFSIGATFATFHDVLAVLGVFYLLGYEINLILLTALLTIAGYSLTDTVVVFDRIRENLRKMIKEPVTKVINNSINEVLSRTLVTSLTVFFASLALYFFGGEVLHDFALAMALGVIVGTYSSVFVASPVVILWAGDKQLVKK